MHSLLPVLAIFMLTALQSPHALAAARPPTLETVQELDLNRYLGKWYEIAAFPQRFQKDCVATTATYSLKENGDIQVLNECRKKTLDGAYDSAVGTAWVPNPNEPAKLKVSFFWPFSGAYWVIELGSNYEYAVVGHPNRKYLWILSRQPRMDEALLAQIQERLASKHFDTTKIVSTLQGN